MNDWSRLIQTLIIASVVWMVMPTQAQVRREEAVVFLDFESDDGRLIMHDGLRRATGAYGAALEFNRFTQLASFGMTQLLDKAEAVTVGGWFFPRRSGEQYFVSRGLPQTAPLGERMFRREETWVNFVLGTDQRGFLLGTINGNGIMPFPLVTVEEVPFDAWNQLVVSKDKAGGHKFYRNGVLVHSSEGAQANVGPGAALVDQAVGEPLRLSMPMGGLIGEAWVLARALTAEEIRADFVAKKDKYHPALPAQPVELREMNAHSAAGLWPVEVTAESWPGLRVRVEKSARELLGAPPQDRVPLAPRLEHEEDLGRYVRRKISLAVQAKDRMPAYLLVPKELKGPVPAVLCFYGTTSGAGKETTVGLSGRKPGSPPQANQSFAVDMVEAGFVALACDYLRDGERIRPGRTPYDTTDFYAEFPDWSIHGKDLWDTSRAIDYLETLDYVDSKRIGMVGHSYGGHSTIFTAALEPRIAVAVANGPVSDFLHHGQHWAVGPGGRNSQSMPRLRPYVLDHTRALPVTFYQFTALIAPRPLLVGQAAGERRPMEEENYAAVQQVYRALGQADRVRYHWYAGDHDFPPAARRAAVDWFRQWFSP